MPSRSRVADIDGDDCGTFNYTKYSYLTYITYMYIAFFALEEKGGAEVIGKKHDVLLEDECQLRPVNTNKILGGDYGYQSMPLQRLQVLERGHTDDLWVDLFSKQGTCTRLVVFHLHLFFRTAQRFFAPPVCARFVSTSSAVSHK